MALVILFISLIFRLPLARWVGKYAVLFGFLISLAAVSGSLFYSEVVGFEPCLLCWYQRIAIYPLLVLFTVAMFNKKDRGVFKYALPLAVIAAVIALYHSYVQWGGTPLIPCDSTASCAKLYVYAYGYVTIPTMSLSVALAMILLWWSNKMRSIL
ncbi:MAG TPA: disulfide bond formation protein B [Candidatus Paceibacterota bacterium]